MERRNAMKVSVHAVLLATMAGAAILASGGEARALGITGGAINTDGSLTIAFWDDALPERQPIRYTLGSTGTAIESSLFACAADGEVLTDPVYRTVVRRKRQRTWDPLSLDEQGRPGEPLTLGVEARLDCPAGYAMKPVEIRFTEVRVVDDSGVATLGGDAKRTFRILLSAPLPR
jgi:hypothetical protein